MIEVLLSMLIITIVLSAAYVTSNRSFLGMEDAQEHNVALTIAQTQVEQISQNYGIKAPYSCYDNSGIPSGHSAGSRSCYFLYNGISGCPPTASFCYKATDTYISIGPPATIKVSVTWPRIGGGSDNVQLYYQPPLPAIGTLPAATPTITSISPASGPVSGGTLVTITGTNFSIIPSATNIYFGANLATNINCTTSSKCTATSPAGNGTVNVTASVAGQTSITTDPFTYAQPSITKVEPNSGPNAGGTSVTIVGKNFVVGSTAFFFGSNATGTPTCFSTKRCQVGSPAGSGTVNVTASVAGQTSPITSSDQYTYTTQDIFNYVGYQQSFVIPAGVTSISIEALGAEGSPPYGSWSGTNTPGNGAEVLTNLQVTPRQTYYVNVGGSSGSYVGGYNGGGYGSTGYCYDYCPGNGGGGGGFSAVLNSSGSYVVIAGGGGGAGTDCTFGSNGGGGGFDGENGTDQCANSTSGGGTQTQGGAGEPTPPWWIGWPPGNNGYYNQGGNGNYQEVGGGGGGGYYGGGSGVLGGGGGGSSYVIPSGTSGTSYASNYQTGNGEIIITY